MTLEEQRDALITYLKAKLEQEDWHGVSDAANDLRVLDMQISQNMQGYANITDRSA